MARFSINLRDLVILVADPSSYMSMLIHSMLRGFGSNKVLEARSSTSVLQILTNQKIDILICDSRLPPHGGLPLTRAIRRKQDNANRTIPILVMTSDGRDLSTTDKFVFPGTGRTGHITGLGYSQLARHQRHAAAAWQSRSARSPLRAARYRRYECGFGRAGT
jgi:CheY-like chemotaxis protein